MGSEMCIRDSGDQLDTELRLLSELPQVYLTEKCVFDRGNGHIANKRGAICSLVLWRAAGPEVQ